MLIMFPEAIGDVNVSHFCSPQHQRIYSKLSELQGRGKEINLPVLASHLPDIPASYVSDLLSFVPHSTRFLGEILDRLQYLNRKRDLYLNTVRLQHALRDDDMETADDLILDMQKSQTVKSAEIETSSDLIKAYEDYKAKGFGIRVGIPSIDQVIGGFAEGEIVYLLGCPGIAKSAMAQNWLKYFAHNYRDYAAIFFSLEMPAAQLGERMLQIELGMSRDEVKHLTPDQVSPLNERYRNIFFYTAGGLRTADIHRIIVRHKARADVRFVVVDFLGRVHGHGKSEYEDLNLITKRLKDMAKELGVVVIALAQVGRERGGEGGAPLSPRSARGSGTIEEDGDFVFGLYRPERRSNLSLEEKANWQNIIVIQTLKTRRTPEISPVNLQYRSWCLQIVEILEDGFEEETPGWGAPEACESSDNEPAGEVSLLLPPDLNRGDLDVQISPEAVCDSGGDSRVPDVSGSFNPDSSTPQGL